MKIIVILLFAVIAITTSLDLPSSFKMCKSSDPMLNECMREAAEIAIISMADGLKEFKILPLEPLVVDKIKIGETEGSVSLKQEYWNFKIHGLTKQVHFTKFQTNLDKLIFYAEAFNDLVDMRADYKFDGKILLIPIHGQGKCNLTMYDLFTKHHIHLERFQKDGETYAKVIKYNIQLFPKRLTLHFTNLFNDAVLGEQMNKFLNENSDTIFKELKTHYEETFGLIFIKLIDNIFTRVPLNKIF